MHHRVCPRGEDVGKSIAVQLKIIWNSSQWDEKVPDMEGGANRRFSGHWLMSDHSLCSLEDMKATKATLSLEMFLAFFVIVLNSWKKSMMSKKSVPSLEHLFVCFYDVQKKLLLLVCSRKFSLMLEATHLSRNSSLSFSKLWKQIIA